MTERQFHVFSVLIWSRRAWKEENPEKYANNILEKLDVVYCDVADPDEVELFIRNCKMFLKEKKQY